MVILDGYPTLAFVTERVQKANVLNQKNILYQNILTHKKERDEQKES